MLRAIKQIRPKWIVGENVRGLISWNGGMVFDEVCADLEGEGYEVISIVIPAASVNAPHKRDRIFLVAHSCNERLQGDKFYEPLESSQWKQDVSRNTITKSHQISYWEQFPTVSPVCDGDDGLPKKLDGITIPKWRTESIKAGGNAVVPQVVLQIFKTIAAYEKLTIQRPSL